MLNNIFSRTFKILQKSKSFGTECCSFEHPKTFPVFMRGPTHNLDQMGSAILTFIGFKRTDRKAKYLILAKGPSVAREKKNPNFLALNTQQPNP